ncbi:hypothetical protein BKA70DRAFT_35600 [Coprinopsis sp. MPI-PUGE-AT-0042]|nr:hypothetical protein BKA70DRAFT_35600 [Coprinopsis sp. MPI-PUGE-AT-0042]
MQRCPFPSYNPFCAKVSFLVTTGSHITLYSHVFVLGPRQPALPSPFWHPCRHENVTSSPFQGFLFLQAPERSARLGHCECPVPENQHPDVRRPPSVQVLGQKKAYLAFFDSFILWVETLPDKYRLTAAQSIKQMRCLGQGQRFNSAVSDLTDSFPLTVASSEMRTLRSILPTFREALCVMGDPRPPLSVIYGSQSADSPDEALDLNARLTSLLIIQRYPLFCSSVSDHIWILDSLLHRRCCVLPASFVDSKAFLGCYY